jgi:hypothetical protein
MTNMEQKLLDALVAKKEVYDSEMERLMGEIAELRAKNMALQEEIQELNFILMPGEWIHEQERDGVTICILEKERWHIRSMREHEKDKADNAELRDQVDRLTRELARATFNELPF